MSFKSLSSCVHGDDIDEDIVDDAGDWGDVGLQCFNESVLLNRREGEKEKHTYDVVMIEMENMLEMWEEMRKNFISMQKMD